MQGGDFVAAALTQISGYAHVAERYGFEEAVFLDSVMFWYRTNRANDRNFRDGRWWTYNSIKAFEEIFPWWSAGQLRRIIARCRENGALLAGDYNQDRRDRTAWYTPSDELLALYGENENCICSNQQMQTQDCASSCAETDKCNIRKPCNTHVDTDMPPYSPPTGDSAPAGEDKPASKPRRSRQRKSIPTHAPERFEQFWQAYPGGGSRLKAVEEWDALAASPELLNEMALALKRQKASRMWRDGVGIPHAFRWLRDKRWTDKLPEAPRSPAGSSTGWADDSEVDE